MRHTTGRLGAAAPRRGVTLVELLVVTAVIGVLAGVLVPVALKARVGAEGIKCKSNLAQIGKAALMYTVQWDGSYPATRWGGGSSETTPSR